MTTPGTVRTDGSASSTVTQPSRLTFTAYVQARGPVLLRTARSLTSDPRDAEDLLQTALTKTYLAWDRIEDQRALDGYVRRALLNTRTSQWRKRRIDEYASDDLPEPEPRQDTDPAEAQALRDAMWSAVLTLPARQRAMVVLRYYEDLSEARTAEVMGVSVGTVKSAVSRALTKLREDSRLTAGFHSTGTGARTGRGEPAGAAAGSATPVAPVAPVAEPAAVADASTDVPTADGTATEVPAVAEPPAAAEPAAVAEAPASVVCAFPAPRPPVDSELSAA